LPEVEQDRPGRVEQDAPFTDQVVRPLRVIDHVLLDRRMTLTELSDRVGITVANLILKTGKARAIRLSTLDAICRELDCQPGDLLTHVPDDASGHARPPHR
jgi:putative transcriptional regulator